MTSDGHLREKIHHSHPNRLSKRSKYPNSIEMVGEISGNAVLSFRLHANPITGAVGLRGFSHSIDFVVMIEMAFG